MYRKLNVIVQLPKTKTQNKNKNNNKETNVKSLRNNKIKKKIVFSLNLNYSNIKLQFFLKIYMINSTH